MSMWTLERAVDVESKTGHVIIRIPSQGTIVQLPPPAKVDVDLAWVYYCLNFVRWHTHCVIAF